MATAPPSTRRTPTALRVLAVPAVAAVLLAGSIFVVGQLLPGNVWVKIGLSIVWFVAAGAVLRRIAERTSSDLVLPFKLAVILSALALTGWYAASFRDKEVQDELVTPPPEITAEPGGGEPLVATNGPVLLARGRLRGIDHTASGRAELVDTRDGVVVQLRDFKVQPGPDYRLYLANGESPDGGRELGALKGTSGNQRYDVERRGDARRYKTVLIWCRAFSVPVAAATLR
ncbi:MAG: DM13 domain-containing protein [Actinomycetota bacterium]|nr:DM13 domain-containing protein [Actinomycetota bacterium]